MDDTTKSIIDRITERLTTPRQLPGGQSVKVFYDCARLNPNDLARLAAQAAGHLDSHLFDMAIGIAYSGIFFASAVAGGREVGILQSDGALWGPSVSGKRVVVVDDVVHRGTRIHGAEKTLREAGADVVGLACIVDRSGGKVGTDRTPLWSAFQTAME